MQVVCKEIYNTITNKITSENNKIKESSKYLAEKTKLLKKYSWVENCFGKEKFRSISLVNPVTGYYYEVKDEKTLDNYCNLHLQELLKKEPSLSIIEDKVTLQGINNSNLDLLIKNVIDSFK